MKIKVGFIGILAVMFFNIFLFALNSTAETTTETKIVVGEGGIHQQTITTETTKKIDWNLSFPENFNSYCMEQMISDYKEEKIKLGYSRNCNFTTTVFSLDPLGFLDVPITEKNWGVVIDDNGVRFNLLPVPAVVKNNFLNNMGIILFTVSWFLLAIMSGYKGGSRKLILSFFCLSPIVLYLLNVLSIRYPFLIVFISLVAVAVGVWAIFHKVVLDGSWYPVMVIVPAAFSSCIIAISNVAVNILPFEQVNNYIIFQIIVFMYALALREVVYAWRKEKLVTPQMVKAIREMPRGFLNEPKNNKVTYFCGCILDHPGE